MKEHTKEKLSVYREYLDNYLFVMCHRTDIDTIRIFEPFAGMGWDENNEKGSALLAAEVINKHRSKKDIRLFLNELDPQKNESLKNSMEQYKDFAYVTNYQASEFLDKVNIALQKTTGHSHNLFFLDPYGYTQYSPKNLNDLLNLDWSDYLFFVPTNQIYRFHEVEGNPAHKFVLDIGISEDNLRDIKNLDHFAEKLTDKLKSKAKTKYGYNYKLVNKTVSSNAFHLFFITKNPKGAIKFLDAVDKIRKELVEQLEIFDSVETEIKLELTKFLADEKTNHELFTHMLQKGYLSKKYTAILKQLEVEGKLSIKPDFKRKKYSFYFGSKNKHKTILLTYIDK